MNAKILVFVICVEAIIYLLYNLHDCTFKYIYFGDGCHEHDNSETPDNDFAM